MQAALEKGLDAATEKILARLDVFHSVSTHTPSLFCDAWRVTALMVRQVNSGFADMSLAMLTLEKKLINSICESACELRGDIDELVASTILKGTAGSSPS